jgi:hypothetical protein
MGGWGRTTFTYEGNPSWFPLITPHPRKEAALSATLLSFVHPRLWGPRDPKPGDSLRAAKLLRLILE